MRSVIVLSVATALLAGCAQKSEKIEAAYVSPLPYEKLSCRQIKDEAQRVATRSGEVMGIQNQKAQNDAVATGVAVVLLWPAAFFIKGDKETATEVANLKGQMNALREVSEKKNCGIVFQEVVPVKPPKDGEDTTEGEKDAAQE